MYECIQFSWVSILADFDHQLGAMMIVDHEVTRVRGVQQPADVVVLSVDRAESADVQHLQVRLLLLLVSRPARAETAPRQHLRRHGVAADVTQRRRLIDVINDVIEEECEVDGRCAGCIVNVRDAGIWQQQCAESVR